MKHTELQELIEKLKIKGNDSPLFKRLAKELERPTRGRRVVNLLKIEREAKENELIIVPGKVLASGELTQKVKIVAYSFSNTALEKIKQVKGEAMTFDQLINAKLDGERVKIIG